MQPITSTRLSSGSTQRNLHDDVTCTTHHRASISLESRLRNPSPTWFQMKQIARSQCVSRIDLPPSVLWCDRTTKARLILRHKPKNNHGDFKAQITKLELSVLRLKPENRRFWFWGSTKKPALLVSLCTEQTAHRVTRPPDHSATEYSTCAWPSPVLCTRSPTPATILIAVHHVAPVTYTP
jgi:hypothetical protein